MAEVKLRPSEEQRCLRDPHPTRFVGKVVQLVEPRAVIPVVIGSSPILPPKFLIWRRWALASPADL